MRASSSWRRLSSEDFNSLRTRPATRARNALQLLEFGPAFGQLQLCGLHLRILGHCLFDRGLRHLDRLLLEHLFVGLKLGLEHFSLHLGGDQLRLQLTERVGLRLFRLLGRQKRILARLGDHHLANLFALRLHRLLAVVALAFQKLHHPGNLASVFLAEQLEVLLH